MIEPTDAPTPAAELDARDGLFRLVMGFRSAKALLVANDLQLFGALASGPLSAEEVAERLHLDPRATLLLMRALAALGLLVCSEGRFAAAPAAERHLVPGRPGFIGDNLRYQELLWDCFSELGEIVRAGAPTLGLGERLQARDPSFRSAYIRGVQSIAEAPAREVARILSSGGSTPPRLLIDVGGGHATYSLRLLDAIPSLVAVVLDLPEVLGLASELGRPYLEAGRLRLVARDYLSEAFDAGEQADLVLLSHVTHDEPPEVNRVLLDKARRALAVGGRVAIHDFVVDEDGCSPLFAALFALNMLTYTRGGRTYSRREYLEMLAAAGFRDATVHGVLEGQVGNPSCLIVASRVPDE